MIEEKVKTLLKELEQGNPFGEKITLVAATKTRTAEEINRAIKAGVSVIGENKVQEFRDKYELVHGAERHFIGHLQTNKVKYLVGRCELIHSVDRDELAEKISEQAKKAGVVQNVLMQVNIGCEETKGGYPLDGAKENYLRLKNTAGLRLKGLMAMLPLSTDEGYLAALTDEMRALLDELKKDDNNAQILSMGMSGDYKLCIAHGANTVRLGTVIFGERDYRK